MSAPAVYLVLSLSILAALVAIAALVYWIVSHKRIAAETVGRAGEHARQLRSQAEREAESLKKEAQLEARERTHALVADAEKKARDRQQEIVDLDKALADRTRALADRIGAADQLERDLRKRETTLADLQKRTEAAAARSEQLLADRQRELQRVASLTADEARDLLLKQIEADARRDAANLVKRLEAEARELAAERAKQIITDAI
jgi:ribonucrease Y